MLLRSVTAAVSYCLAASAAAQMPPAGGPQMVRRMRAPPSPPPVITGEAATVPMSFSRAMPVVEVTIGGRGPYRFGIDTGAQGHGRISAALAAELGLAVVGEMQAGDGSGRVETRRRYRADGVALGPLTFNQVELTELNDPGGRLTDLHGILGLELFAERLLTLDYAGRTVTVTRESLPGTATAFEGQGQIVVPLMIGERTLPTRIDTGNSVAALLLPAAIAEALPRSGPPRQIGQARTALSSIQIWEAPIAVPIRLGGAALPIAGVAWPALGDAGNLGSLALGSAVLRIDQVNRRLDLRFVNPAGSR